MKDIKHYRIKRKLGTGGMGEVHEAFDTVLERKVAIKVVHRHLLEDPKTDERFMNEARAAAKLVHPNIVTIYEVGQSEEGRYIAMEFVNGRPLTCFVEENAEQLKPETAIKLAMQTLSGLQCAHNMGILHRDIKPDNILVLENDLAKILDFGIAKIRSKGGLTVAGDILGTVEYMAPEQMLGEKLDHRCDVYSAGVVLYQLLTRQLPFSGDNPVNILYKALNEDPAPPSHYNRQVGQELDQVVLRAITKSKEDRWESAEAFSNALEAILRSGNYPSTALSMDDEEFTEIEEEMDEVPAGGEFSKLRSVFVGREKEFKRVIKLFHESSQGRGNAAIIRGEAGVGKSTLTERFQNYAAQNDAWVLYGACLYQDGMDAYLPFIDAVRGFFSDDRRKASEEELTKIKDILKEKIPGLYRYTEPLYTTLGESLDSLYKQEDQGNLSEAILQFLSLLSSMHPVVLTIDDLHWADEASLQLFHYLTHRIERSRILLIGISRTDRYDLQKDGKPSKIVDVLARIRREGRCQEITLYRLAKDQCERLIDKALSPTLFTEEFYDVVYNETKGNPLFVLETLKLLRDSGGIFFKDGAWYNKQEGLEVTVPNRVEDVFVRRLSVLNDEERELLQVAAVCGYKFDASQVSKLTEISKIKLLKTLQRIEREIQVLASDEQGFHFEHPMLRDLLYKEIPAALSREYHLMIAEEIEERYNGDYGAAISEAAQHFRRGGDHEKATPLLYQAGEKAFGLKAFREAGILFMDFLDSEDRCVKPYLSHSARSYLYAQLGNCHEESGRWKESIEAYNKLLDITQESDDFSGQVNALKKIGRIQAKSAEWDKALETYELCLTIVEANEMDEAFGWLYNYLGIVHFEQGHYDQAIEYLERTIEASNDKVDAHLKANALMNIGIIFNIRADYHQALDRYKQALEIFTSLDDDKSLTRIYHNIGLTHADNDHWEQAIEAYERCLELTGGVEDKQLRALVQLNIGKVYAKKRDLPKAKKYTEKALKMFKLMGDVVNVAEAYHIFGLIQLAKGNLAEAELFLNQSININSQKKYYEGLADANVTLGELRERQEDIDGARTCYEQAMEFFEKVHLGARAKAVAEIIAQLDGNCQSEVKVVTETDQVSSSKTEQNQDFLSAADIQ